MIKRCRIYFLSNRAVFAFFVVGFVCLAGNSQTMTKDVTVREAMAPVLSAGALLLRDKNERININVVINEHGEVNKATLADEHNWVLVVDDNQTVHNLIATAKSWRFDPSVQSKERRVTITFIFRVMPESTGETELTSRFIFPFTFEVRTNQRVKIEKITDTKRNRP